MKALDRTGIFKANIISWGLTKSGSSESHAVSMEFQIISQYVDGKWASWADYEEHGCRGDFWIIGKSGDVNEKAVDQLANAIGWMGALEDIQGDPPPCIVQIVVKDETYNGTTRYRAAFINHEDYVPKPSTLDDATVKTLNTRYGSLLRAAAGAARKTRPRVEPSPFPPEVKPPGISAGADDSPF